jgi:hypothetical protein
MEQMEGLWKLLLRHDSVLKCPGVRMTNPRLETSTKRPVRGRVFHTCKTDSQHRPLHLLPDAARGASLTQPKEPAALSTNPSTLLRGCGACNCM